MIKRSKIKRARSDEVETPATSR